MMMVVLFFAFVLFFRLRFGHWRLMMKYCPPVILLGCDQVKFDLEFGEVVGIIPFCNVM